MRSHRFALVVLIATVLVLVAPRGARAQGTQLSNPEAIQLALDAVAASKEGRLDECIAKNRSSLEKEDNARTRLHLSGCEARSGKILDALKDAQEALQQGMRTKDDPLMKVARERVIDLVKRLPKITFQPPSNVTGLSVTFDDDHAVPIASLTKKFSIDPGTHRVHAEGTSNGLPLVYDESFDVKEGQLLTVNLVLKAAATPGVLTRGQLECVAQAKSQEEAQKCIVENVRTIVTRLGTDIAGYTDSTNVHVFTPEVRASITAPTAGWNVGGSYLVDFVTAASPDIVSEASRRYRERRHVVSLTGGYKPGAVGAQVSGNVSSEPDYLSITGGGAVTLDLNDKLTTPRLSYSHSDDTIGRSDTPFSVWSKKFHTEEFEGSCAFVLSPTTVLVAGLTFAAERGDQSKPYRFVPLFPKAIAERVPSGASPDLVNLFRLPMRPAEQLPTQRDRYAVAFRFAKRVGQTTLRLEERLYDDSWSLKASTTDLRYMIDLTSNLRVWPHGRFHAQTGTNFDQLAYTGVVSPQGQVLVPTWRTTDRELSPLVTLTGGGGARLALSSPQSSTQFDVTLTGDAMYTQYFRALYIRSRVGLYGVLAFDVEF